MEAGPRASKALEDKAVVAKFELVGTQLYPRAEWTPEALTARVKRDIEINARLLADLGK